MTREDFIDQLNELADYALQTSGVNGQFTGAELANATLVFFHIFMSLAWENFEMWNFTMGQRSLLAEELGRNFRQTVLMGTGIDLRDEVAGWGTILTEN